MSILFYHRVNRMLTISKHEANRPGFVQFTSDDASFIVCTHLYLLWSFTSWNAVQIIDSVLINYYGLIVATRVIQRVLAGQENCLLFRSTSSVEWDSCYSMSTYCIVLCVPFCQRLHYLSFNSRSLITPSVYFRYIHNDNMSTRYILLS